MRRGGGRGRGLRSVPAVYEIPPQPPLSALTVPKKPVTLQELRKAQPTRPSDPAPEPMQVEPQKKLTPLEELRGEVLELTDGLSAQTVAIFERIVATAGPSILDDITPAVIQSVREEMAWVVMMLGLMHRGGKKFPRAEPLFEFSGLIDDFLLEMFDYNAGIPPDPSGGAGAGSSMEEFKETRAKELVRTLKSFEK